MVNDLNDKCAERTRFCLEFAKHVLNANEKETQLLSQLSKNQIDKFYLSVSPQEVQTFFDLIDGDVWNEEDQKTKIEDSDEDYYFHLSL